ncbi:MAG: polysaccharide deacetylase family protein [Bacteroidota bacterium]
MNILTFDIEEWFHILDNESTKTEKDWHQYPERIHQNMDRLFALLEDNNVKATFFCLGWVAEKYPDVIKEIVKRGYHIGSHSNLHPLVYELTPKKFEEDLRISLDQLEQAIGEKVTSYRAPGFSITENALWSFEILAKHGITHDASVFPAARSHGGLPILDTPQPFLLKYNGIELKEFPINYHAALGQKLIFSGGGYFRILPYPVIKRLFSTGKYNMTYFHPRDFDPDQPVIPELSAIRKFKSYVGLKGAFKKLDNLIKDFKFVDLLMADDQIDWDKAKVVDLSNFKHAPNPS